MSTLLLTLLLALPTGAFAQKVCYSPSDCTGGQRCTSLDNGVVPGVCANPAKAVEKTAPVAAPKVPKPAPKSSSSVAKSSSSIQSSSVSSVRSSNSSVMSSSSVDSLSAEEQSRLTAMMKSMMDSFMSIGKGFLSTVTSISNSVKCMFGGC